MMKPERMRLTKRWQLLKEKEFRRKTKIAKLQIKLSQARKEERLLDEQYKEALAKD